MVTMSRQTPSQQGMVLTRRTALLLAQRAIAVIAVALLTQTSAPRQAAGAEVQVRSRTTLSLDVEVYGHQIIVGGFLRDNIYQGLRGRTITIWLARPGWEEVPSETAEVYFERSRAPSRENALFVRQVRTDRNGRFRYTDVLDEGQWLIGAEFDGGPFLDASGSVDTVELSRSSLDLQLRAPAACPMWASCPIEAITTIGGEPVAGRRITLRFGGLTVADGLLTDEEGVAHGSADNLIFGGITTVQALFAGDSHFQAADVQSDVVVYQTAEIIVESRLVDRRESRQILLQGRLQTDQGVVPSATIELQLRPGSHDWTLRTDESGEFSAAAVLDMAGSGQYVATASFQPYEAEDPQLSVEAQTSISIERPMFWHMSNWAKPIAALVFALLAVAFAFRRATRLLDDRRRRQRRVAPPGRSAPEGLVEFGPPMLAQPEHATVISGVVRDADTNQPLRQATVSVASRSVEEDTKAVPVATDGSFNVSDLAKGKHQLLVEAPGYVATSLTASIPHRGRYAGIEVFVVSVRSWVRHHYQCLLADLDLENGAKSGWGWLTPRQIEEVIGRVFAQFRGSTSSGGNLEIFCQRLQVVLDSKTGQSSTQVLDALTLLIEEVYFSSRIYAEDMVSVCRSLTEEIRCLAMAGDKAAADKAEAGKDGAATRRPKAPGTALIWALCFWSTALSYAPCSSAQPAPLAAEDYAVENTEWNGLSTLYRMLVAGRPNVVVNESIDLAEHVTEEPIAIIYPTGSVPIGELAEYVFGGGRLFIADDFGSGSELMSAFDVSMHRQINPHETFFRDNRALPVFFPTGQHPLTRGVELVLGNHATPLSANGRPVVPYDDPAFGLVYDLKYGEGRVVALGDPSLMINFMLDMADNRTLVNNIFRYLCEDLEPCTVHLASGDTVIFGDYPGEPIPDLEEPQPIGQRIDGSLANLNDAITRLAKFRPNPIGVHWAAVFLSLGVTLFLMLVLPLNRPRWLRFRLTPAKETRSRSEFEWNLERLVQRGSDGDFALPLAILKDELEGMILAALARSPGEIEPDELYDPDQMDRVARRFAHRVAADLGETARRAAAARMLGALRFMATIPNRNNLVPEVHARYSERTFRRAYAELRALIRELGLWEEYEQRTGRP